MTALESGVQALPDEALKAKTAEFRTGSPKGETLDALLPEAFAVAREASRRVLKQRQYDVQLMGGVVLHRGSIAEMRAPAKARRLPPWLRSTLTRSPARACTS